MPVYSNQQRSVGSRVCAAIPSGESRSQELVNNATSSKDPKGNNTVDFSLYYPALICWLFFFSAFAACWLPRALTARQTSKYSISIAVQELQDSIAGERGSHSSPSHSWCRGVYLSLSCPQALNVRRGQGFCSSQAQILEVAKYVTDGSSEKQLLEVLACYFTSKQYEGSYQIE